MSFGSFEGEGVPRLNAEINTTPLVDVMLVLLVVFILTAPLLAQGIRVDLPQASSTPLPPQGDTVQLSIEADGSLHWNETLVSPGHLEGMLHDAAGRVPQPEIRIRADGESPYRHVASVLAAAQAAGVTRIGFVTRPDEKASSKRQ